MPDTQNVQVALQDNIPDHVITDDQITGPGCPLYWHTHLGLINKATDGRQQTLAYAHGSTGILVGNEFTQAH
ncbi:MAG: hypothetical protein U5K56_07265 [Halioglobus sp.]|nr:hypothetical protein [Halioglobus sp.]